MIAIPKTYSKYKDSRIEWVNSIPYDWEVKPLRYCCSENIQKNTTLSITDILSLSYGNIILKGNDKNFGLVPESYSSYQILHPGDLVMRLTDLQNDHVSLRTGLVKNKGIITSAYLGLKIRRDRLDDRFFHWLLHSYDLQKVYYGMGGGIRQTVGFDDLKWLPILIPNIETQKNIASFLDKKTKIIDKLIVKKEKLLKLLSEKRRILIINATRRGIDAKEKMKHSGIEWIGYVPESWDLKPLKYAFIQASSDGSLIKGGLYTECSDGLFPAFSASGQDVWIDVYQHDKPGIVLSAVGARCGKTFKTGAYWTAIANTHAFFAGKGFDRDFLWYLSDDEKFWERGGTAQPFVLVNKTLLSKWSFPSIEIQKKIVNFLDSETLKLDQVSISIRIQVGKLKEYRSSLIYSAVTGKIKV